MILETIDFPEPVIGIAIEPKTQADIDKMGIALNKLAEEDPTFQIRSNVDTGQTTINGMGELHLEILLDRLKREFKVECNVGTPQVNYKEALTREVKHREVFKKQTGGRGKFADIEVYIGPPMTVPKDSSLSVRSVEAICPVNIYLPLRKDSEMPCSMDHWPDSPLIA